MAPGGVVVDHAMVVEQFYLAIEAVAAEVNQAAAAFKDPVLEAEIHILGPVFGVGGDGQALVFV